MDRKGKKALLTDNSKAVKTALKSMQGREFKEILMNEMMEF